MKDYNNIERKLAKILSSFPKIKAKIKRAYVVINYLLNRPNDIFISNEECKCVKFAGEESFFGYYDHSPINESCKYIIFHSTENDTSRLPKEYKQINICLYDVENNITRKVAVSSAFNWQQGSRLIWLDDDQFIFNDYDHENDCYQSKIYSVNENKITKILDSAIYDSNKKYAVTINFKRLTELRPDYGYFSHKHKIYELEDDLLQVLYIDINTGDINVLFDINEFVLKTSQVFEKDTIHKFNHLMISPDGQKIMFLHRYYLNDVRTDRLVVYNLEFGTFELVTSPGVASHCYWLDSDTICGYFMYENLMGYHKYNLNDKKTIKISHKLDSLSDGHPNIKNKSIMVSDTYPNKSRMKELFEYDFKTDSKNTLALIFEPLKFYGEVRCDLHPRLSPDGKIVFFDSVHSGKRQLYMMRRTF
ncbi:glycosyl transferase [Photobacterium swingsii]|uniref:glycosyl transferase n=1 Tax=Photobacterium swingsii TaxID=680026 RepID=UPI0040687EF6